MSNPALRFTASLRLSFFVLLVLASVAVPPLRAQYDGWEFIGPHFSGAIEALHDDGAGTIYAQDQRFNAWRSSDDGRTWTLLPGSHMVVGSGPDGVVYSATGEGVFS